MINKFPFSEHIQRGTLSLFKNNEVFHVEIAPLIKPEYFEFPIHQKLFSILKNFREEYGNLANNSIIIEEVRKIKNENELMSDYEDELVHIDKVDVSSENNPDYYLNLIESFARKQAMVEAIKSSMLHLKEGNVDAIETEVKAALTVSRNVDVGMDYYNSVVSRWKDSGKSSEVKFGTIFPSLDLELEGGTEPGEMAMFVAPPGVGKSIALCNQGRKALTENKKVLHITGEMSEKRVGMRYDSIMSLIPMAKIAGPGKLKLKERLNVFKEKFPNSDLRIKEFPTGMFRISNIRALLNQLKNYDDFVPDVIIVDYLELMRPSIETNAEYQAQQIIARDLRGLAMEMKVMVWTATQTNREGRRVRIITDAELGDSYGKIREADLAISLNQTEEEYDSSVMRAFIMKNRNGKQRFIIPVSVDYQTLYMEEGAGNFENEEYGL
jgi:replicative DNA helicase